jgi:hypothetical protein
MTAALITSLLRLPVRLNGIELARPVDALVDDDGELAWYRERTTSAA